MQQLDPDEVARIACEEGTWEATTIRRCRGECKRFLPLDREHFQFRNDEGRFRWRCLECERRAQRERRQRNLRGARERDRRYYYRMKADPVRYARTLERNREAERRRRRDSAQAQKRRRWRRTYEARRRADEERNRTHLENRRISENLRRRDAGVRAVPQRSSLPRRTARRDYLPIGPFRAWLIQELRSVSIRDLAEWAGTRPRVITRLLRENERGSIDLLDRITTSRGQPLAELYGELYEDAA